MARFPSDTFGPQWTSGEQRSFPRVAGRNADCGQSAAGVSGVISVGSIHPVTHRVQPAVPRRPVDFDVSHGQIGAQFRDSPIPPGAQGVCYYNIDRRRWHYARIEGDKLVQTDANRFHEPGMGGTFMAFAAAPGGQPSFNEVLGQRGVQPPQGLRDLGHFVDYCEATLGAGQALYYFCRFDRD